MDVFASSEADPGELYVAADTASGIKTTPMTASAETGPKSFYARVAVTGNPANVTVKNIGDAPTSSSQVAVTKASPITVTDASYDGAKLHVAAISAKPGAPLTVAGYASRDADQRLGGHHHRRPAGDRDRHRRHRQGHRHGAHRRRCGDGAG